MVKRQQSAWRRYTRIWEALISFVIRTLPPSCDKSSDINPRPRQMVSLYKMMTQCEELV
jgi:hypothetical protein